VEPVVEAVCATAARAFEDLGCELDELQVDFSDAVEAYAVLNANRRGALIAKYLPDHAADIDPLIVGRAEFARSRTATDAAAAEIVQTRVYQRVRALFERYDLLMLPTAPVPGFELGIDYPREIAGTPIKSPFEQLPLTFVFNMTGHPAISVPAGWTDEGWPIGLQIVGRWRDDVAVLRAAAAFERAHPWAHRWPTEVAPGDVARS
jgi:Asp-tRNA(Asn)/Glu-tRNA(Gln) amidotransferase A subunit family amidase